MKKVYNKLVRDKIPEIIKQAGKNPVTHIANDEEYIDHLERKLMEEYDEWLYAVNDSEKTIEELADILTVIFELDAVYSKDYNYSLVYNKYLDKLAKNGSFNDHIILEYVEEDDE